MNLNFNVDYQTKFGEEIILNVVCDNVVKKYRMNTVDGMRWTHHCVHADEHAMLQYFYSVEYDGTTEKNEWTTMPHRVELKQLRQWRQTSCNNRDFEVMIERQFVNDFTV